MRNITVVGAGNGGHAIAGYTSLLGNNVVLLTSNPNKKTIIRENGNKIKLNGIIHGEGLLRDVTTDVRRAVTHADLIFIVTDATAHKIYAKKMAPHLTEQDIVLSSPGVGGALEFYHIIRNMNPNQMATVSETDTLIYACKVPETGTSLIKAQKNSIIYTTIPQRASIESDIQRIYPQFKDVHEPLMGIDDSPVFHICGMIFNSDRIRNREDFNFYIEGITPDVTKFMEEMDNERCKVAERLGIEHRTIKQWLNVAYGVDLSDLYTMIQNTPPYQNTAEMHNRSPAPKTLHHRYLLEEVLLRAVPTVSIAEVLGVEMPKYKEMIRRATELTHIDFLHEGRKLENMGLTSDQIKNWKSRKHYK